MNSIRQREEARQFLEEVDRRVAIAARILENAQPSPSACGSASS